MNRPELPLFLLALVTVVGSVVLIALGHDVPSFLQAVVLAAIAGGAGLAVPRTPPPVPSTLTPAGQLDPAQLVVSPPRTSFR